MVYNSDSAVTPLAGTTTATRALYMTGNAVKQAAEAVRARLVERAARAFGVAPDDVDMGFNEVFVAGRPDRSMPLVELVRICGAEGIHRSELAMFRARRSPTSSIRRPARARPIPTTPMARMRSRWRWTSIPARSRS